MDLKDLGYDVDWAELHSDRSIVQVQESEISDLTRVVMNIL
jgi:hypothetical protein